MKKYTIVLTHNEWGGSLERIIYATDIESAKATVTQSLLLGGRIREYNVQIIPTPCKNIDR